jgi:DNA-binding NtrC family response regulator
MGDDAAARERDFYRRLLDLGGQDQIEPLLDQALALIVEVTGARTAYLELHEDGDDRADPRFWRGHNCTPTTIGEIRTSISHGIIAQAIAAGRTMETPSALSDPRFEDLGSVRRQQIDAVMCAPVGTNPPVGVVYLQGRTRAGSFTPEDRERAELFARQLAPLAARLTARPFADRLDHTREIRLRFKCPEIVGTSPPLAHLLQETSLVAPLDVDVLISGPSGTGKSALARAIHDNSRRASGPFVALNCAAIPESLIENELFGAERGAHSMANRRIPGKIASAEGGTLFLDEVAELSAAAQAKLLHLLQAREYHPLGATEPVRADVRIISATNADLLALVATRRFREDLYYRLHVLPLAIPGLTDRREDIPELVTHFCAEVCRRHGLPSLTVSRRAALACREAPWPGHVRQLANAIEAAVIRAHGAHSETVDEHHVFPSADRAADAPPTFQEATRVFQRRLLLEALERNDWNIVDTTRELGLARSHLYNLINAFSLKRDDVDAKRKNN